MVDSKRISQRPPAVEIKFLPGALKLEETKKQNIIFQPLR